MIEIRKLTPRDAAAAWRLRLIGLEHDPGAFGSSAAEHRGTKPSDFAHRLTEEAPDNFVLGAFIESDLAGMAGFYREPREKRRHIGGVWGVVVVPEARGRGIGRLLMRRLIAEASIMPGLTAIQLSASVNQHAAVRLYQSLGFVIYGIEPRGLCLDDEYIDQAHMILILD